MSVEVNQVVEGEVTGITKFGAFVQLEANESGLVHISEVADAYVKEISDYLAVGDKVKVKVIKIADDGKISLSIRKAQPKETKAKPVEHRPVKSPSFPSRPAPSKAKSNDFDSMMSAFLKDSDDRLASLRKNTEGKRGGRGGRRS
ncbi:RNA-binding protein S1 [Atopobacter sp. AH10]|uniref:S1 domain-containing RNA-binding protein n=1 Tax=Atopobacter sp. AH10 TaxID=2315861 RepID=UPI000EF17CB0|nr:S1 domain-containing RNA-binding protein [Atopobacter sp. AH10]RLK63618.1 RNA-binding protein S1 [Atopobacter sp. AH10]